MSVNGSGGAHADCLPDGRDLEADLLAGREGFERADELLAYARHERDTAIVTAVAAGTAIDRVASLAGVTVEEAQRLVDRALADGAGPG